jgi:hypothetical protein
MLLEFTRSAPRTLLMFVCVVLSSGAAVSVMARGTLPDEGGPTTVIITYRCLPANRPHFRDSVERTDLGRFEKWKTAGILKSYRLLFNWYTDADTWDLMAILSFHKYSDIARWKEIERTSPGGLSDETLRWGAPANTYSADLTWSEASSEQRGKVDKRVFFVIPYDVLSSIPEYRSYVAGYVIPQMKGWINEGILSSYSVYLNRYYAGTPWDSLLILEYKDLESFGQRESIVTKVRAVLNSDAKWKALSENKKNVRTEREPVLSEELIKH